MLICKVVGHVWATKKEEGLEGPWLGREAWEGGALSRERLGFAKDHPLRLLFTLTASLPARLLH